jgi:hypothetical protein
LPKDTAVKCHCVISQKQANKSKLIRCHLEVKQGRRSAIKASSSYAANNTEWQKIKPLGVLSSTCARGHNGVRQRHTATETRKKVAMVVAANAPPRRGAACCRKQDGHKAR